LPFELLVEDGRFLIETYRIRYAPSLTALHLVRLWERQRAKPDRPLWAVGDPVYDAQDNRLTEPAQVASTTQAQRGQLARSEGRPGAARFPRLEHSAAEVQKVAGLLQAPRASVHLGLEAQEARVKALSAAGELARVRYVHFATHGILGLETGGLQPSLVLSQVNTGDEDGFLQLDEVTALRLNADLVVLSACRTGQGRLYNGEGVRGLARAFLYAGCKGVVCSLWAVSDRETVDLMTALYDRMRAGQPAAEALRAARLALLRDGKAPLYWAPFILIGE
jgi:CHAT domain-containing protein